MHHWPTAGRMVPKMETARRTSSPKVGVEDEQTSTTNQHNTALELDPDEEIEEVGEQGTEKLAGEGEEDIVENPA